MKERCSMIGCNSPPSHRVRVHFLPDSGKPPQSDMEKDYCHPHAQYTENLIQAVAKVPLTVEIAALA